MGCSAGTLGSGAEVPNTRGAVKGELSLTSLPPCQAPQCQQDQLRAGRHLPGPAEPLAALALRQQDPEPGQGHLHLSAGHPDPVSVCTSSDAWVGRCLGGEASWQVAGAGAGSHPLPPTLCHPLSLAQAPGPEPLCLRLQPEVAGRLPPCQPHRDQWRPLCQPPAPGQQTHRPDQEQEVSLLG